METWMSQNLSQGSDTLAKGLCPSASHSPQGIWARMMELDRCETPNKLTL